MLDAVRAISSFTSKAAAPSRLKASSRDPPIPKCTEHCSDNPRFDKFVQPIQVDKESVSLLPRRVPETLLKTREMSSPAREALANSKMCGASSYR